MAKINANVREERGSRRARRLREQGLIPGIIYGHGADNMAVTISEHAVELALLHGERVLELDVDGQTQNVLIKDIQYDTFGQQVLHVDLARVDLDERVEVEVPILLRGTPADEEAVLQQTADTVTVECAVRSIPEEIEVRVNDLRGGDILQMKDLPLPEGVTLLDDPEDTVATMTYVSEEEVAPAEEGEEVAAEPEVIGREAEAEEEEEGEQPEEQEDTE
ncbi:MAG: 50S ribosomal protein L25 [Phycisphaerae bacterium]